LAVQTLVTSLRDRTEFIADPETGAYIDGLWLEGAAWELGASGAEGYLIE
jgi:dynein heavy chain